MAIALNGSNQFLTVPVNAAFEFGTGDFAVSCKALFNNLNSQPLLCLGRGASSTVAFCGWLLVYISNRLYWYRWAPAETSVDVAWTPSTNTPYTFTVSRISNTLKLFVDAAELISVNNSTPYNRVNDDSFYTSYQESGAGIRFLNGVQSEIAIWKGAGLNADEVVALSKGFTAPQIKPQNLSFYAPLVRDLQDLRNNFTITNNGGATVATHPRVIT